MGYNCCIIKTRGCITEILNNARTFFHFVFTTYQYLFNGISTLIDYFCKQRNDSYAQVKNNRTEPPDSGGIQK